MNTLPPEEQQQQNETSVLPVQHQQQTTTASDVNDYANSMEVVNYCDDVKSQAVVKYCNIQHIKQHQRLECNTNLNKPPCNWMFKYSGGSALLHQALHESPCFTSFQIAHMFTSCVGEVDVVSDAENIKKLLKLPFQPNGVISMIVHKVGNTLLLDEFDVQRYLARRSKDDWKWLDKFFSAHILPLCTNYHNFFFTEKSRAATKSRSLLSKFLYRSLRDDDGGVEVTNDCPTNSYASREPVLPEPKRVDNVPQLVEQPHKFNRNVLWTFEDICMLIGTDMPIFGGPNRPCISLRLRDMSEPINVLTGVDYWLDNLMCNVPEVVMCYHLDGIVQKYEIIKTEDLPYLENSQFSPQFVHNVAQNILAFLKANATKAGHTYWLFKGRNDDVVKLYDLSTLSTMDNDGKGKGDNSDGMNDEKATPNPFTVPVAMLLYSVARNMKHSCERITPKRAGAIRSLLMNCVKLLDKKKYPQIVSSSHYILADLYMPVGIDPKEPVFDMTDDDSECWDEESFDSDSDTNDENATNIETETERETETETESTQQMDKSTEELLKIGVMVLKSFDDVFNCTADKKVKKLKKKKASREPLPLVATTMERCRASLMHISAGIGCLEYFDKNEERLVVESEARAKDEYRKRIIHEEQNINMAKPFKPIPLPYVPISESVETTSLTETSDGSISVADDKSEHVYEIEKIREQMLTKRKVTETFNNQNFGSWNVHLKLLFLEKASLVYATLAESEYMKHKFGAALQYNNLAIRCQTYVLRNMHKSQSQQSASLARAADCYLQIAKNFEQFGEYANQFEIAAECENNVFKELIKEPHDGNEIGDEINLPNANIEKLLRCSIQYYERAININRLYNREDEEIANACNELHRRLGNAYNELGLKCMFWAQDLYTATFTSEDAKQFVVEYKLAEKIMDYETLVEDAEKLCEETEVVLPLSVYVLHVALKSYVALCSSVEAFLVGKDNINLAFIHCNLGRYHRFRAHLAKPDGTYDYGSALECQRRYYKEAFCNYEKALEVIVSRHKNPELWDIVQWEWSSALFNLAKCLQDSDDSQGNLEEENEKIILVTLRKALASCYVDQAGPRQILYIFRAGLLHKRIGSLHFKQLRSYWPTNSKFSQKLSQTHYDKAMAIFGKLNEPTEWLACALDVASMHEFSAEKGSTLSSKLHAYNMALLTLTSAHGIFDKIMNSLANDNDNSSTSKAYADGDLVKLLSLLENRMQFILRDTLRNLQMSKEPKKTCMDVHKKMYLETLTGTFQLGEQKQPTRDELRQKLVAFKQLLKKHFEVLRNIRHNKDK